MVSHKTRWQIMLLIIFSLGIGGFILRAQVPLEVGRRDWASSLPDGEGKGLVLGTCTQCHSLNPVVLQRKTARAWELSVQDMILRGAQIHVQEVAPITSYLARSFGPDASPLAMSSAQAVSHPPLISESALNAADTLPEGEAKTMILRSCTSCHVLSKTTGARKDDVGWRGNVKDMVRLGAKLRPEEETAVVAYLVKHFGRQGSPAPGVSSSAELMRSSSSMNDMAPASTSANPAHLLPDDEGKGLILATCVQCHASLGYVLGMRKNAEGWRRTVDDMISRGAQVTPQEAETIINYLAKHMEKKGE